MNSAEYCIPVTDAELQDFLPIFLAARKAATDFKGSFFHDVDYIHGLLRIELTVGGGRRAAIHGTGTDLSVLVEYMLGRHSSLGLGHAIDLVERINVATGACHPSGGDIAVWNRPRPVR